MFNLSYDIKITGAKETVAFFNKFNRNFPKEFKIGQRKMARFVRDTMKRMVPSGTGELKKSISIKQIGYLRLGISMLDYGFHQENGFLNHFVSTKTSPHLRKWLAAKGLPDTGGIIVQKNTPFIQPALEKLTLRKTLQYYDDALIKAVSLSR